MSECRTRLYFFGSLLDLDVLELVVERPVTQADLLPACLHGFRRVRLSHDTYPMLVPAPGRQVQGAVFDLLSQREYERVRFFEADEYRFEPCRVVLRDGAMTDALFCAEEAMPGGALDEWHLEVWQRLHKPRYLEQASRFMAAFGCMSADEADYLWSETPPLPAARRA